MLVPLSNRSSISRWKRSSFCGFVEKSGLSFIFQKCGDPIVPDIRHDDWRGPIHLRILDVERKLHITWPLQPDVENYQHRIAIPFDHIFELEFKDNEVIIGHKSDDIGTYKLLKVVRENGTIYQWTRIGELPLNSRVIPPGSQISRLVLVDPAHRGGKRAYIWVLQTYVIDTLSFYGGLIIDSTSSSSAEAITVMRMGTMT